MKKLLLFVSFLVVASSAYTKSEESTQSQTEQRYWRSDIADLRSGISLFSITSYLESKESLFDQSHALLVVGYNVDGERVYVLIRGDVILGGRAQAALSNVVVIQHVFYARASDMKNMLYDIENQNQYDDKVLVLQTSGVTGRYKNVHLRMYDEYDSQDVFCPENEAVKEVESLLGRWW